jgi:IS5 family transposase
MLRRGRYNIAGATARATWPGLTIGELKLTAAQASDIRQAEDLLAGHEPEAGIADAGYDSDALAEAIAGRGRKWSGWRPATRRRRPASWPSCRWPPSW